MSKSYKEAAVSIPTTEAAIITASGMTELELVLPKVERDEDLPEAALFLVACAMRYHADPEFVQEQLAWLAAQERGTSEA
jgi:hypothetical protein